MDTQHPADALQDRLPDPPLPDRELPADTPASAETDRLLERLRKPEEPGRYRWLIYLLLSVGLASTTTAYLYQRSEIAELRRKIADLEKKNAAQQPPPAAQPEQPARVIPPPQGGGLRIVPADE